MIEVLFGNKTAAKILLYLERHGEACPTELARNLKVPLNMIQKQLEKFERSGILSANYRERRKVYSWSRSYPLHHELHQLLAKEVRHRNRQIRKQAGDPADGTHLSLKERVCLATSLSNQSQRLSSHPRYRPFVKSFKSVQAYEKWRKKQTNPWLI